MSVQLTINSITGQSPYDVYVCQSGGIGCFYIATITSVPYTFTIPAPFDNYSSYRLKIVDNQGCVITAEEPVTTCSFITQTPMPTSTVTPTVTTTPTNTPTVTPTTTVTPTETPTNTPTPTVTPTITNPSLGPVLFLDAADSSSYNGTGSTWYDLTQFNNDGNINGATYLPDYGGYFNFNGVNNDIDFTSVTQVPIGNENYTISVWFSGDSTPFGDGLIGILGLPLRNFWGGESRSRPWRDECWS